MSIRVINKQSDIPRFPNTNILYHGIMLHHFLQCLEDGGKLKGRTSQRKFLDGKLRRDRDEDYDDLENLRWMYGWSMSRCLNVSKRFGGVVLVFDRNKIAQRYKIREISWNFTIGNLPITANNHKREKEEFVMSGAIGYGPSFLKKKEQLLDLYGEMYDEFEEGEYQDQELKHQLNEMEKVINISFNEMLDLEINQGKTLDINDAIGIYYFTQEKESENDIPDAISQHPLFLGVIKN